MCAERAAAVTWCPGGNKFELLNHQGARQLGSGKPIVVLGEEEKLPGAWAGRRLLSVEGKSAFELGFWCGTCPFLFERLKGASQTLSIDALQDRLNAGLAAVDDQVTRRFGDLLSKGEYLPLLLEIKPAVGVPDAGRRLFRRRAGGDLGD